MDTSMTLLIFMLQVAIPLVTSLLVAHLLLPALQPLLEELCGGATRARFWTVFTRLVFYICPLLVVLMATLPVAAFSELLRTLLVRTLIGALLALGATAFVIWRTLPRTAPVEVS